VYLTKTYSLYEEVNGIEKYALDFLTDYYEKKNQNGTWAPCWWNNSADVARIRLVHQTIIALVRTSHFFTDIVFAKLRWRVYTYNIPTFYRQTQPQYAFRLIVFFTVIVSVYLSVYWYLGDGDTDRREILHDGRYRSRKESIPRCPQGAPKSQILTANISKTVSRSVTYQIGHNTGSTRAFQRCITWDSSAI